MAGYDVSRTSKRYFDGFYNLQEQKPQFSLSNKRKGLVNASAKN